VASIGMAATPLDRVHRGRVVVIAGPDGSGKSTLAAALAAALAEHRKARRFHSRIGVLPAREAARRVTTTPQAQTGYPRWLAAIKVTYLALDHLVGWALVVRPFVRSGGWVIFERGWSDLVVDPSRYRLPSGGKLPERLGRLLPRADMTVILEAPATVIHERKNELSVEEIERQMAVWRSLTHRDPTALRLDAAAATETNVRAILAATDRARARWLTLPPGRPRVSIPVESRRAAVAGLRVYQPVTTYALALWGATTVVAGSGALRVLGDSPAPIIQEVLAEHMPPGGTLAVRHSRRADRAVALLLDRNGRPVAAAKVALDPPGRAKLEREVTGLTRVAARLAPPLSAPALLRVEPGLLLFEPVAWRVRVRPWMLPVDVAEGVGRLHRRADAAAHGVSGPGHGDLAPWNIFRTNAGWCIFDWEEASEAAPDFEDPFHYLVQAHALLGRPRTADLLAGVRGARGRSSVRRPLLAYADAAGLDRASIPGAFVAYLERSRAALRPNRSDRRRGIAARDRLLEAMRTGR